MEKTQITITSDDVLTVPDAAKAIGIHFVTLYRRIEAGKIVAVRLGGVLFIPKSEIDRVQNEKAAESRTAA